jgi:hypothetical protein
MNLHTQVEVEYGVNFKNKNTWHNARWAVKIDTKSQFLDVEIIKLESSFLNFRIATGKNSFS